MDKPEVFVCSCHSPEHNIIYSYCEDDNSVFMEINLNTLSFWKRLVLAIKYIFGYKSKYGMYDEFILGEEYADKLIELGEKLKKGKNETK